VANGGFCVGVLVVCIRLPGALFHQIAKPSIRETIGITIRQITAQLINRNL
jgi:hypothetical protein